MVVIAESTRRFLGDLFEHEDLEPKDLKGIEEPVPACAVMRASARKSVRGPAYDRSDGACRS